jgi:hypothetical protein
MRKLQNKRKGRKKKIMFFSSIHLPETDKISFFFVAE